MALIKCPECNNNISDQADICPKCGYELNKKIDTNSKNKSIVQKNNLKYLVLVLIVVIGVFFFFQYNNKNDKKDTTGTQNPTTPSTNNGYSVYNDSYLGISFEIPNGYKVTKDSDGYIYVGKNIEKNRTPIPYIIIGRYDNFSNEVQFLNSFTNYMRNQYSDLTITIDLVSGIIGNRTVYGLAYNYNVNNHLIVDNRYAVAINNKIYMVGSKEENTNSKEINDVVEHILSTLNEGGV